MNRQITAAATVVALTLGAVAVNAHAHGQVQWSVTVGSSGYPPPATVYYYPQQPQYMYGAPPPVVYVPPAVVYRSPPPVYVMPPPVLYFEYGNQRGYPLRDYRSHDWSHDRHDWSHDRRDGRRWEHGNRHRW